MNNPIKFAFAIMPKETKDGTTNYTVYVENDLDDEAVIGVVRTWLRTFEEQYYQKFNS